jgi:phage portal protein BeeE
MQHQVEEICRWFGVPPQKVGHLLRMTFNNVEQLSIEVVVDSIAPWAIRFEEEANYKLFGSNRPGFFIKLDLKGLLRGAFKDRQEGLQVQRRNGVINAAEWRELEDMDPMAGPGGHKFVIEGNMTTLERVGEAPAPAAQAPAPASDPATADVEDPAIDNYLRQNQEMDDAA